MQVIYKNENKRKSSQRTDLIDFVIYRERISRYIERKYTRRLESNDFGMR